ncbi:MAG: hypothetical protein IPM24_26945 [Bryobacterales bacterium]|nr:hypothetical protein [Bryobacterales bacterium]
MEKKQQMTPSNFGDWPHDEQIAWLASMVVELVKNQRAQAEGLGMVDARLRVVDTAVGQHHDLIKKLIGGADPDAPAPRPN